MKLVYDHQFSPFRYKVRRWRNLNWNTCQYSRTDYVVWLEYLLGCWSPLLRSDPSKVNLHSCRRLVSEEFVWMMSIFMTMLTHVKIKIVIFRMANFVTMLLFDNLWLLWKRSRIWKRWRWTIKKEPNTWKLDGFGEFESVKWDLLVISKSNYVLIVDKLFPRSDDRLRKCRLNLCLDMQIFSLNGHYMWINLHFNLLFLAGFYLSIKQMNFINKN